MLMMLGQAGQRGSGGPARGKVGKLMLMMLGEVRKRVEGS